MEIDSDNDLRWIQNDKLAAEARTQGLLSRIRDRAQPKRNDRICHGNSPHVAHDRHFGAPVQPVFVQDEGVLQGEATMRDVPPKMEHLPVRFVQVLTALREKTNKSAPSVSTPESLTAEELRDRPTDAGVADDDDDDDDEGDPWDALDANEYEGPSVGKAKASHAAPPDPKAKAPPAQEDSTQATPAGEPTQENELKGTIIPKHATWTC